MKVKWPKEVPYLTKNDIHCGSLDDGSGRHCLLGWARTVFQDCCGEYEVFNNDHPVIVELARAIRVPKEAREYYGDEEAVDVVMGFNDSWAGESRKQKIANTWNKTMAKLGYTEPA